MYYILFSTLQRTPRSTLFLYTTLFRSSSCGKKTKPEIGVGAPFDDPCPSFHLPIEITAISGVIAWTSSVVVPLCDPWRSEEHTSELQSQFHLVCRLLLEKKNDFLDLHY